MRNINLGQTLKLRRVALRLTLRDVTAASGVSASHLARIERGERNPSAVILGRLAKPLGFRQDELFKLAGFLVEEADEGQGITLPQEDAAKVLAVGHKVMLKEGLTVGTITAIRVWHDMDTLLGPPYRGVPIFDIQGEGWKVTNAKLEDLVLWELPTLPEA